ncbi:MAG: hypothetical protein JWL95_3256 [Gemmatimonadetes bacterium]|nr:hypothetical protein [Gemmatimonadota bacterium]
MGRASAWWSARRLGGDARGARSDVHGAEPAPVSGAGDRGLEALRERFQVIHGPRRTDKAYWLALLLVTRCVLEEVTARRERAERQFNGAWVWESTRAVVVDDGGPPPTWDALTWRALERLAAARALEWEWFALLERLLRCAGAAVGASRAPRPVVMYGDDGSPFVVGTRER